MIINLALVGVWAVSRTTGLPFGHEGGAPEAAPASQTLVEAPAEVAAPSLAAADEAVLTASMELLLLAEAPSLAVERAADGPAIGSDAPEIASGPALASMVAGAPALVLETSMALALETAVATATEPAATIDLAPAAGLSGLLPPESAETAAATAESGVLLLEAAAEGTGAAPDGTIADLSAAGPLLIAAPDGDNAAPAGLVLPQAGSAPVGHGSILADFDALGAVAEDDFALTPPAYQIAAMAPKPARGRALLWLGALVLVACLAAIAGVVASQFLPPNARLATQTAALAADATRLRGQIAGLNADVSALTGTVRNLGTNVDTMNTAIETADRNAKSELTDLAIQIQSVRAADIEQTAALAAFGLRLNQTELAVAATQTAVVEAATSRGIDLTTVGTVATARPTVAATAQPQAGIIDGWVVLDVSRGRALVEGRRFGLFDVAPGSQLPGVGSVQRIEQQNGRWVVVTAAGLIPQTSRAPFN